nr:DUF2400 domain-containing protein [Bacteroidota bacterium]
MDQSRLKEFLEEKTDLYNRPSFINDDPVAVPHGYTKKQDIEIAGFFAATLAWGQRKTILRKCRELMEMMGGTPHDFILNHTRADLVPLLKFKHRTFTSTDLTYFLEWLRWHYSENESLETAFSRFLSAGDAHTGPALAGFHNLFFSLPESPQRTRKHIATPDRKAACK